MVPGSGTDPFAQIGRVVKSHGLNGELKIRLEIDTSSLSESLSLVYLQNQRGDYYPCRISSMKADSKDSKHSFFVHFEHIADRNSADSLRGNALYLESDKVSFLIEDDEPEDSYLDFEVVDEKDNHKGLVVDEIDNGAQLVLVVATTSGTLMIPLVDQFLVEINEDSNTIRCRNLNLLEG